MQTGPTNLPTKNENKAKVKKNKKTADMQTIYDSMIENTVFWEF